jgi:SagB-type dehydrogenase family enzyme
MHQEPIVDIRAYHRRTRHFPHRYALGPAFLDWESQPHPFRRFDGAPTVALPMRRGAPTPAFGALEQTPAASLNADALGLFLELALGLTAWKSIEGATWSLRANPSSGNLHPTEGWVLLPELADLPAGLHHYAVAAHALEARCPDARAEMPPGCFVAALSAVPWREAWKYGERSFRYCQLDAGHALACLSYAAACLGWRVRLLPGIGDEALAALLGLDRRDAWHRWEQEVPELAVLVGPAEAVDGPVFLTPGTRWAGQANRLSEDHDPWPAVDRALLLTRRPELPAPQRAPVTAPHLPGASIPAGAVIRARRSAQRMDGKTALPREAFLRALSRCLPDPALVPWESLPFAARLALFVFVHRVEGVAPGLYALLRDPAALERLRADCRGDFAWTPVPETDVPLLLLAEEDLRRGAAKLNCLQPIAGGGAFSVAMLADFDRTLREEGDWAWRRLHWEAGMVGQVLYLEATAAGFAGTGIGCFFDEEVHATLGLGEGQGAWQCVYGFTVGVPVVDSRLVLLPPE